ncbi:MAG: ankyrin repeat domain-containing protein [Phycisphaerae bacterium]|nr:ankyrin repeat domain-containing protein [Phycisphaerae bacterium]
MRASRITILLAVIHFCSGCIQLTGTVYRDVPDPMADKFVQATPAGGRTLALSDGRQIELAGIDILSLDESQRAALDARLRDLLARQTRLVVIEQDDRLARIEISGGHPFREGFPVLVLFPKYVNCPPVRRDVGRELILAGWADTRPDEVRDPAIWRDYVQTAASSKSRHVGIWMTWKEKLCDSAGRGNLDAVRTLVARYGEVDAVGENDDQGRKGWTPLMYAAVEGRGPVVSFLVGKGARVNARGYQDRTPLSVAAGAGRASIVRILIDAGADPEVSTFFGTPLEAAVRNGREEVVEILLSRNGGAKLPSIPTPRDPLLRDAALHGRQKIVELLVAHGADVNEVNRDGQTPLAGAAWNGHQATVEFLLARGANINARDRFGYTALKCARQQYHNQIANILRKAGARE